MLSEHEAFNIEVLKMDKTIWGKLGAITSPEVWETGSGGVFNENGFYSNEIFGIAGTDRRMTQFGYIDLNITVLTPVMFKILTDIKGFYSKVLAGVEFAEYDKVTKDIIPADALDGHTGYEWFMKQLPKIDFKGMLNSENLSVTKEWNIKAYLKNKEDMFIDKFLVLPAGLRDYIIDNTGNVSTDEINTYYRKIFNLSNLINKDLVLGDIESLDEIRYNIQTAIMDVYTHIIALLDGKKMFMLGKFAKRNIHYATRNVLTSPSVNITRLDDMKMPRLNDNILGMYQYMKMMLPFVIYSLKNNIINDVFPDVNMSSRLVDKKTLKGIDVDIDNNVVETWISDDGIEGLINKFIQEEIRDKPVEVEGYYLALIYKGDGVYKLFHSIDDLPEELDKDDVYPVTLAEILYIHCYKDAHRFRAITTRDPITGVGSVTPNTVYLKSTAEGESRVELDSNWDKTDNVAIEFPIQGVSYINGASLHLATVSAKGGDEVVACKI